MHLSRFTLFLSTISFAALQVFSHPAAAGEEPTPRPTFVNEFSDLNQDNVVDDEDLMIFMQDWGKVTGPEPLIEMVTIPAGSFLMGNSGSERSAGASERELPRHLVNINYSFLMGKYEVTNAQYVEVLNWAKERGYLGNHYNGAYTGGDVYHDRKLILGILAPQWDEFMIVFWYERASITYKGSQFLVKVRLGQPQDNHPVHRVTWYGAVAFCNWLSEMEGRNPAYDLTNWTLTNPQGGGYRLPSEAEWEYACRGSAENPNRYDTFSFGDDPDSALGRCSQSALFNQYMVWCGNSNWWSRPVGIKLPNDYGLHDMHGNVRELCDDWWHYSYNGAPGDGSAWLDGNQWYERVVRGGDWNTSARGSRSAQRLPESQSVALDNMGFRVVRSP